MKINTFSALSVFLAAVVVTQAAPAPAYHEAPRTVPYHGVNPDDPYDTISGYTELYPKDTPIPKYPPGLSCWGQYYDGRDFGITCKGDGWYVWTRCSNGNRYSGGPITGTYKTVVTCPWGTTATEGGAYAYGY
ncbi:MAG: hypothetical protein J3Q66DRAFT_326017 [Benniella sp.]|nr:MAG: hypothetical protein J3Q66DRAFT_326017 [Benniella sp.]